MKSSKLALCALSIVLLLVMVQGVQAVSMDRSLNIAGQIGQDVTGAVDISSPFSPPDQPSAQDQRYSDQQYPEQRYPGQQVLQEDCHEYPPMGHTSHEDIQDPDRAVSPDRAVLADDDNAGADGNYPGEEVCEISGGSDPNGRSSAISLRENLSIHSIIPKEQVCMDARDLLINSYSIRWFEYELNELYLGWVYLNGSIPGYYNTKFFLKFDHEALIDTAPYYEEVVKAEIVLSPFSNFSVGPIGVYRITEDWSLAGDFTDTKGDFQMQWYPGRVDWDNTTPCDVKDPNQMRIKYHWDITELFSGWENETIPNYGVCVAMDDPPETSDPPPSSGDPFEKIQNMRYPLDEDEDGGMSPSLTIFYKANQAPQTQVLSVSPDVPVEGTPVTIKGTATDPDGDGISKYKWWTDDGILAEGPDKSEITVDLSAGQYEIFFSARDDHSTCPRWSDPISKKVFVDEPAAQQAPRVSDLSASENGVEGTIFSEGVVLDFKVSEALGMAGLSGTITIRSHKIWVNRETLVDLQDGSYSYTWDTQGVPPGEYSVDVTLENLETGLGDLDGLRPESDLDIIIRDTTAPRVATVAIPKGLSDGIAQPGTELEVQVKEHQGESTCTGTLSIDGPREMDDLELRSVGAGLYLYEWDTTGWPEGDYSLNVQLSDQNGNTDVDGVDGMDPDLSVVIRDTQAPQVMSVLSIPEDGWVVIKVQEALLEEGLSGVAYVDGPDTFEETLQEEDGGWYMARINTTDLEPGLYQVETSLWDINGNTDYDGLLRSPDVSFTVIAVNTPPTIELVTPQDGEQIEDLNMPLEAVFSEPVVYDGDSTWAMMVFDGYGEKVSGTVNFVGDDTIVRFVPSSPWVPGDAYSIYISPRIMDEDEGGLEGILTWSFSVIKQDPPGILEFTPVSDPVLEQGTPVAFTIGVENVDTITWQLNGVKNGSGTTFQFTPDEPGRHLVEVLCQGPGGTVATAWEVTVLPEESDDETQQETGSLDVAVKKESSWSVVILLSIMIVLLLLVALFQYLKGNGSKGDGNDNGGGGQNDESGGPVSPGSGGGVSGTQVRVSGGAMGKRSSPSVQGVPFSAGSSRGPGNARAGPSPVQRAIYEPTSYLDVRCYRCSSLNRVNDSGQRPMTLSCSTCGVEIMVE